MYKPKHFLHSGQLELWEANLRRLKETVENRGVATRSKRPDDDYGGQTGMPVEVIGHESDYCGVADIDDIPVVADQEPIEGME